MAIILNQAETNLSGETLLASSSLENSISEARNLSIELDQKSADLRVKADEFKQESETTLSAVFDRMDKKETAFTNSINRSADNAANKISKSVNELKQGSNFIKNIWIIPRAITIHVILFFIEIGIIFWFAIPPIKQAKEVLSYNENVLQTALEIKKDNERILKENQGLYDELVNLNQFINFVYGDKEKARQAYRKWRSNN
jgi:hypothetical protein